jgi:FdhE protein
MTGSLRKRAGQLKKKWPAYGPLVDFYVAVRGAQKASKPRIRVTRAKSRHECPLIGEEGFPIDIKSSANLFAILCGLGKAANPHFATQAERIEQALADGTTNLEALLAGEGRVGSSERTAVPRGVDARILSFLVVNSTLPSIEAARDQVLKEFEPDGWRECSCPVCGSPPALSVLTGNPARRHSVCSHCRCEWLVDRVSCSVCGNRDQDSLQCFYGEGEMAWRIDLCDICRHYIKTIDFGSVDESDPSLEDLATLHLDVVATEKGYARAAPNFWISRRTLDS